MIEIVQDTVNIIPKKNLKEGVLYKVVKDASSNYVADGDLVIVSENFKCDPRTQYLYNLSFNKITELRNVSPDTRYIEAPVSTKVLIRNVLENK